MNRLVLLVSLLGVALPRPALAIFGVADTGDGILASILSQNVQQSLDLGRQLAQVQAMLQTTRENLDFVRSTYGLVQAVGSADPARVLALARQDWMASQPVFGQANALASDMARNGLRGGYGGAWTIQHQIDIYRQDRDAEACGCDATGRAPAGAPGRCVFVCIDAHTRGWPFKQGGTSAAAGPYDAEAAARLAAVTDTAVYDQDLRRALLARQPTPDTSSAIVFNDIATRDPAAADALLRRRAVAAEAAFSAHSAYTEASGRDPTRAPINLGRAQVLTAQSSALAAEQLAAIREQQAKQVTMQEAQVASEANERQQDALQLQMHALHMADLLYLAISGHNTNGSTSQPGDRYQP